MIICKFAGTEVCGKNVSGSFFIVRAVYNQRRHCRSELSLDVGPQIRGDLERLLLLYLNISQFNCGKKVISNGFREENVLSTLIVVWGLPINDDEHF